MVTATDCWSAKVLAVSCWVACAPATANAAHTAVQSFLSCTRVPRCWGFFPLNGMGPRNGLKGRVKLLARSPAAAPGVHLTAARLQPATGTHGCLRLPVD